MRRVNVKLENKIKTAEKVAPTVVKSEVVLSPESQGLLTKITTSKTSA